jgi:predicted nucleic acid-binding protein
MSERIFVDSSAYFAANDPRGANHAAAAATLRRLVQQQAEMYTTNYIVAETHTLLLTRHNRDVAAEVLARLDASNTRIIPNDGRSLQNLPVGARHASPARAARFSNNPDSFGIIRATEAGERRVREIIRQYTDKDYSLIDAISFAVMGRLHLRLAWTYDHHFAQFGLTPVP